MVKKRKSEHIPFSTVVPKSIVFRGERYYLHKKGYTLPLTAKIVAIRLERKGVKTRLVKKEAAIGPDITLLYTRPKMS